MAATLKTRNWIVVGTLLALIALGIAGLVLTRDQNAGSAAASKPGTAQRAAYVDQGLLRTARQLAASASDREERRLAQQVLRLADHEVDLAFAIALRDAAEQRSEPAPQARPLYERVKKAESVAQADQQQIDQLKKQLAATPASRQDAVQQRLDLAQAQFELDQDELEDAQEDLTRSGADTLSRVQRQFTRYQASSQQDQNAAAAPANKPETGDSSTLVGQFGLLQQLRGKSTQLRAASQAAADAVGRTRQIHDALEQQLQAQKAAREQVRAQASSQVQSSARSDDANGTIASLRAYASQQKDLSDLDKRIQDQQELADTYSSWIVLVQGDERAAVHRMLISAVWIVVIVLLVYLACRLIDRLLVDLMQERNTLRTLRTILRFAVQAIGLLVIALIVFGIPSQMSTILGLAGAGLTVALKDFIVGFFGWFVLMGKNGIRVGDWVEINGVVGEVVEINWLRTVLLETGNWNDSGHPTGRKVAFVNSFAIEGHFFNFSTTGQWLWDELQLLVPAEQDPYPILDEIQKIVAAETAPAGQKAEQEWKSAAGGYRVQSVSAKPAIDLRPTALGVEIHVRYITNAGERYAMRAQLYQSLVGVLHGKRAATPEASPV
jgi:small-conductance mechanosensitive channel